MSKTFDMREWLSQWPYDPENAVRIVTVADGREVLQVRTPLGIEQYELEGRPDGKRPRNSATAFDFFKTRLARYQSQGRADSFGLNARDCAELFEEGVLFYFRYLHLFSLKEWARVARDTGRNLSLFDFVRDHARREQDRAHLEQWRPYIIRMNTVARAMIEWEAGRHAKALRIAGDGAAAIEALPEIENETFQFERDRSLESLREMVTQLEQSQPLSELQTLERELHKAVEAEQFERAASLRDRIRALRSQEV